MFKIKNFGASVVLCNFLDGAIADYEEGMIDNTLLIEDCIATLEMLGDLDYEKYQYRYKTAKDKMER